VKRALWAHGWIALGASLFGFAASYLYLGRSQTLADPWALKMAIHMAGWHLILALTLFPASVFGGRAGVRVVQAVSALFFAIHVGIALANSGEDDGPWIAIFNAASGILFLAALIYGQSARKTISIGRPLASSSDA
jgi:hypothetical protein